MAGEEPPYLTVGTDVSAKYKGAFCEAKIKKVTRSVKCKVNFKNNMGMLVVTDDLVRGTLRVGAHVEAKHPEKNQYLEGVINKLHDYSQYTVVFDDGDETTLRRTSLCLKSGRHFAESETLDQLPLTHPEHFGTPVMGSKGRKRRILHRSLIVGDGSSDEEPVVRKKDSKPKEADPDMGKVVCLEVGERKKKENWVPALVVAANAQDAVKTKNKDECIVRSFKDGKFHVASRKDSREFTRELAAKVDGNAMKTAVEKALAYLEQNQLPPHWDREVLLGAETPGSVENSDTDSDSSDDEQSEEKDRFVAQLYKFMDDRGTPINKAPLVANRDLNLYKLFKVVQKMGGYNRTTNQMQWKTVYAKMGLPCYNSSSSHAIKQAYKKFLHSFEDFYRKLGCTMGTSTRSGRVRHRPGRNLMLPRDRDRRERDLKAAGRRAAKQKEKDEENAKAIVEEEKSKAGEEESSQDEPESGKTEDESQTAGEKPDVGSKKDTPDAAPKAAAEEKEKKSGPSKSDKKAAVDEDSDTDDRRHMREIRARLQKEDSEEEDEKSEREDSRCRSRSKLDKSEDSTSPNKRRGRKKSAKKGDDDDKGSDEDDAETRRNVTININDRVKVKYGRGRQQKIYEAKVLKLDEEEGDRIYFVHYTGWNMRYDEWVKRHRIVENLTQRTLGKRTRLSSIAKCSKPPGRRGRPQGSTSLKSLGPPGSKGGLRSQTTRSDRSSLESSFNNGPDGKRRTRKSSGTQESGHGTTGDSSDECYSESVESEILEQMERRLTRFRKKRASLDELDTSIEEDKSETQEDEEETQGDEEDEGTGGLSPDAELFKELPFSGKSFSPKDRTSKDRTEEDPSDQNCEEEKPSKSKRVVRSKGKAAADSDDEGDASAEEDQPKAALKPPVRRSRGRPAKCVADKDAKESPKSKPKDKKPKPKKKSDVSDKEQSLGELDESKDDVKIFLELKEKVSALPKVVQSPAKSPTCESRLFYDEKLPAHESDHQYSEAVRDFHDVPSILFSEMSKPVEKELAELAKIEDTAIPGLEDNSTRDLNLTAELDFTMYDDVLKEDMGIAEALKIVNEGEANSAPNLEKIEPLDTLSVISPRFYDDKAPELVHVKELQQLASRESCDEALKPVVEAVLPPKETVAPKSGCERLFESLLACSSAPPGANEKESEAKSAKEAEGSSQQTGESSTIAEPKEGKAKCPKITEQDASKVDDQVCRKSDKQSMKTDHEIVQAEDQKSVRTDLKAAKVSQFSTQDTKTMQEIEKITKDDKPSMKETQKLTSEDQKSPQEVQKVAESQKSPKRVQKTPREEQKALKEVQRIVKEGQQTSTEVQKTTKEEPKTPKDVQKIEKEEQKTPKEIHKFAKEEQRTPKEAQKTAKGELKTAKDVQKSAKEEQKTPKDVQKMVKEEQKTPKDLTKTASEEQRTPKDCQKTAKEELRTPKEVQKTAKEDKVSKEVQKIAKEVQKFTKEENEVPAEMQKLSHGAQNVPRETERLTTEVQNVQKEAQKMRKDAQITTTEEMQVDKLADQTAAIEPGKEAIVLWALEDSKMTGSEPDEITKSRDDVHFPEMTANRESVMSQLPETSAPSPIQPAFKAGEGAVEKSLQPVQGTCPDADSAAEISREKKVVKEELEKIESLHEASLVEKHTELENIAKKTVIKKDAGVESFPSPEEEKMTDTSVEEDAIEEMVMSKIEAIQDVEMDRADSPLPPQSSAKGSKRDRRRQKTKKPEKRKVVAEGESSDEGSVEEEPKVKKKKNKEDKVEERREKSRSDSKVRKSREKRSSKSRKGDSEDREEGRSPKKKGSSWKSRRKECKKKKESLEKGRKEKEDAGLGPDSDDTSSLSSEGGQSKKKAKKSRRHKGEKGPESEKKKSKKSKVQAAESEEPTSDDSHREVKKARKEDRARPKRKKEKSKKEQPQTSEESDGSPVPAFQEKGEASPEKTEGKLPEDADAGDISSYLICEEKVPASPLPEEVTGSGPVADDGTKEAPAPVSVPTGSGAPTPAVTAFAPLNLCPKTEAEPSTVLDNTPPTTPESTGTNASESPLHPGRSSPLASPLHDLDSGTAGEKSSQSSSPNDYASSYEPHYDLGTKSELEVADEATANGAKEKMVQLAAMMPKRVRSELEEAAASPRKKKRSHRKQMSPSDPNKVAGVGGRHRHGCSKFTKGSDDSEDVLQLCTDNAVGMPAGLGSPYHPITSTLLETQVAPHSPRPSRFNFYVELDDYSDGAERIAVLQEKLTELRRTYLALKAEVACIDRRRKKLKRKEKEASSSAPSSSSTTVECS